MDRIEERMEQMSQEMAEVIANLEARIAERAEMIVLEEGIVGFLLRGSPGGHIEDS